MGYEMKYQTKDFIEATALMCIGFEMTGLEDSRRPGEWLFTFKDSPDLQKTIKRLYSRELMIEPLNFGAQEKRLKKMLYEKKDQEY